MAANVFPLTLGSSNEDTRPKLGDGSDTYQGDLRMNSISASFRQRLRAPGRALLGTFVKSPSPQAIEIFGDLGFDFVIIDAEHAPLDRGTIDHLLLAAKASGIAALVRVAETSASHILSPLDSGAAGVIAPHIDSVEKARALVAESRYSKGRGFSNSPRAGGYGQKTVWQHVDQADDEVIVVGMIEDPKAVTNIEEILCVDGLDAVFIGRGDMAVALNDRQPGAPVVQEATSKVISAAKKAGKTVFLLAATPQEAAEFYAQGVGAFVISSDQGFLRTAAANALSAFTDSDSART